MKNYSDVQELKKEINSYVSHFAGLPLLVGIDNSHSYRALLELLSVDPGKQILRMSDKVMTEFPPQPKFFISDASTAAKAKPVIWLGAAQSIMLYGQKEV